MSGETVDPTAEEKQSDIDQMSSGYSDEPREPTETPATEVKADPEPQVVVPKHVQLTEDDYNNLMRSASDVADLKAAQQKMIDTAFGRIGRAIEDMKSSATPVAVTIDDFPELKAEFPELADLQVKGLNKVLGKIRGGAAADPAAISRMVSDATTETRAQLINSHLDGVMTDWDAEVKKPEFTEWMAKQPEEIKALANSDNVRDAAKMLRAYAARPKPAAPKPPPKADTSTRQGRLEAAVIPKGSGGNARSSGNSDIDEMNAGYNS